MMETDDELLKQFFSEQKKEIADNGFTRRVIRHLPDRRKRLATLWTMFCSFCAVILFFAFSGIEIITRILHETMASILRGEPNLDLTSLFVAVAVLVCWGVNRICSME
ncbi:hypothetical protein EZS27_040505 [termite gut metagenome]|uniref:DUF5056 domain-containing protein n=1 Tax=termite gut metagenome TaxID=433724 RepID=A0A5J4PGH2_9ZZZZ